MDDVFDHASSVATLVASENALDTSSIAELIVEIAARGEIHPGQRLKEQELAERFEVSRLPVREALTELASQGVVYYAPRRGARLMEVDGHKLRKILEVRERLETLALRTAFQMFRSEPDSFGMLDTAIETMRESAAVEDRFGIVRGDIAFHRALCILSGNEVLVKAWSAVSRQMIVVLGLEHRERPSSYPHVEIHRKLRETLAEADIDDAGKALSNHILQSWAIADDD